MRDAIKLRALKCIDEVCPGDNSSNALNFPLDDFLDEAALRVVRAVPLHALGSGKDLAGAVASPTGDGSGRVALPEDFIRLIIFRMKGWRRPVTMPIRPADPSYRKQFNRITRGGTAKPVVALIEGDTALEYFSLPEGSEHRIALAHYFGFSKVDGEFPAGLVDLTAWQLANIVLTTMNDTPGVNFTQNKINELIALL